MAVRLGELLLREKRITPAQLQEALNYQKANGGKLGMTLVKLGMVKDEEITALLSRQYGVPFINLSQFDIDASVLKLIPAETAQKYQIVPIGRSGATLTIAMTDPTNVFALDDIKFMTGYNVEPVVASENAVGEAIQKYYSSNGAAERLGRQQRQQHERRQRGEHAGDRDQGARGRHQRRRCRSPRGDGGARRHHAWSGRAGKRPVIRMVNLLLMSAIQKGASDIHVEPYEREFRVRFRIDGILYTVMQPPMKFRDAITSRVKIMAKLDIAEKRLPQDGRIKIRFSDNGNTKEIDFRVSCLPTLFGEKIVMRLLDKDKLMLDMTRLGFEPESLASLRAADLQAVGHGASSPAPPAAARPTRSIRPSPS